MANKYYQKAIAADTAITGQRFCTSCQMNQKVDGGKWIKYANGMKQRWKCRGCLERAKIRAAAPTAVTS